MNIPDEAVEAAYNAIIGGNEVTGPDIALDILTREQVTALLEAAAPHIAARAWDEGREADDFEVSIGFDRNPYRSQA